VGKEGLKEMAWGKAQDRRKQQPHLLIREGVAKRMPLQTSRGDELNTGKVFVPLVGWRNKRIRLWRTLTAVYVGRNLGGQALLTIPTQRDGDMRGVEYP